MLAIDLALTSLLAAYGVQPNMTMGHSLGEYGALVAAGALPFEDALEAVSARGRGMTRVAVADKGKMAAVFAPLSEIERILKTVDGYVVIANINSDHQAVIGGATDAVTRAIDVLKKTGYEVSELPVSHAFHTSIVAPASGPLPHPQGSAGKMHPAQPQISHRAHAQIFVAADGSVRSDVRAAAQSSAVYRVRSGFASSTSSNRRMIIAWR